MFEGLRRRLIDELANAGTASSADHSVAIGGDNINSPITVGLDEEGMRRLLRGEIPALAKVKGVPEAPLRAAWSDACTEGGNCYPLGRRRCGLEHGRIARPRPRP